ncbi:hypothetical protein BBJ28_00016813, partial [Nothophytophthora sp. Chile5]
MLSAQISDRRALGIFSRLADLAGGAGHVRARAGGQVADRERHLRVLEARDGDRLPGGLADAAAYRPAAAGGARDRHPQRSPLPGEM